MKKIIASTGLAALGAASLQAAYAPGLTAVQTSKPWSVSAAVRGFYDDNYVTRPSQSASAALGSKRGSWGMDLNPSVSLNFPLEQTYIGLTYSYDLMYYQDRADLHQASADHVHQAKATLSHQFSPHYKLDASDSFVVAQQPELLTPGTAAGVFLFTRANGNNLMNNGTARFTGDLTDRLGGELAYANTIYSFDQKGNGSLSALLDRMEHLATADLRWNWLPTTTAILGYQFGYTDYTSHQFIDTAVPPHFLANIRNARAHYAFVGVDQTFTTQLSGSVRVGFEYTEYPNAPAGAEQNTTSPYADASLTYTYNPGSYVQAGVKHQRSATYLSFIPGGNGVPLLDSESTSIYAMVNHKITAKLTGNVMGSYQNAAYHVPGASDKEDNYFNASVNLSYQINQFLAAEASYNYYRLDSDIPDTSFTRNVMFFGLRASY